MSLSCDDGGGQDTFADVLVLLVAVIASLDVLMMVRVRIFIVG